MQLAEKLSLAACSLLSVTQSQASDWLYDASVLTYSEKDSQGQDRVSIIEPVLSITKHNAADDYVRFGIIYDSLTGATPNGANASSQQQFFNSFSVLPGFTPLDPNFNDERIAVNVNWMKPFDRLSRYEAGLSYSSETDYKSVAVSFSYLQDLNNKLTTLTLGGAYSYDAVNPHGGFHDPFTSIYAVPATTTVQAVTAASGGAAGGEEDSLFPGKIKQTFDGIIGLSHILNRFTLLNLNLGISYVSGYQTDPYKIISVIDSNGLPVDYVWEKRPDTRLKHTVKGSFITAIGRDSLHLEYRYYGDDWGITSNTYDMKYHLSIGDNLFLVPHYRLNQQSEADFFRISLDNAQANPAYASADYRLGDMTTTTVGGMVGYRFNAKFTLTINAEQITQTGDNHPAEAVGDQQLNDMFPELEFWAVTLGVRGKW
ncbi:MAG: DUF3570 domain-containing protein [Gammaproteobacteria bacterium]